MFDRLIALEHHIGETDANFREFFRQVSGWRGIFDPYCAEWHDTSIPTKAIFLQYVSKYISLSELIELWKKTETRDYVLADLDIALRLMAQYCPELHEWLVNNNITRHEKIS